MRTFNNKKIKNIAVVGIGYVGLPLSIELHKHFNVTSFDFSNKRIDQLNKRIDINNENNLKKINKKNIKFTYNESDLKLNEVFIICVPTPILKNTLPDLKLIKNASEVVGKYINKNSLVIYESTVYPGLTEEICIPILEKKSNLKLNKDFLVGYSPERINPSDKKHTITNTIKVVSGSNTKALNLVDFIYKKICKAGTYKTNTIKEAESSKIIENIQRDLNIALMNELSIIFHKLNIDFNNVLRAASTKWNFINFQPGLVGGHCIGIDPYYLTYQSKKNNYNPQIILSGRKINDSMHKILFERIKLHLSNKKLNLKKLNVLILGASFKTNCSDYRNSRVINFYNYIKKNFLSINVYDPLINSKDFYKDTKIKMINKITKKKYNLIIFAVNHDKIMNKGTKFYENILTQNNYIFSFKKTSLKFKNEISI